MTGQERRQQLLDIGRRLFAERGFEGTSIEEIAAQAGVSKPVVYEHFGGKEGLYAVVVDREVERLSSMTTVLFEAPHSRPKFEAATVSLLKYIEDNADGFRILVRDSSPGAEGGTYGTLRITAELRYGRGIHVGKEQVHLLMRRLGIYGLPKRRLPRGARVGKASSLDLVRRRFSADGPDRLRCWHSAAAREDIRAVRLLLIGAPGAGKGTQADLLAARFGIAHISSGDLLRQHVRDQTSLGQTVKSYVDNGDLVPDSVVMDMLRKPVLAAQSGYVLDGFPRTVEQAKAAYPVVRALGVEVQAAIHLDVPREELVRRLLSRGRGSDDSEAVVEHRLHVYLERTVPLLEYYAGREWMFIVDGARPADAVHEDIVERINKLTEFTASG